MDKEKIDLLKQKIAEAELVLVGVGEEWEFKKTDFESDSLFLALKEKYETDNNILQCLEKIWADEKQLECIKKRKAGYDSLASLLKNKNYFVVSLCTDNLINESGLNNDRIVQPCGNVNRMQCIDNCESTVWKTDSNLIDKVRFLAEGKSKESAISFPCCPKCGKSMVFNTIIAENYAEEGYLEDWKHYTKWLQGTVNRNVCILELGVGMRFPTVIRWPFEKVTFFNQKATLFRVHSKLFQTTEEIKDRSVGIKGDSIEILKELSCEL